MTEKPVHTLVLDAGPIIKNEPAVSSLLAQAESLVTTPAVISEIRDAATRSRVETMLMPFLTLRNPKPESIKVISEFARKTGDLSVLSRPDIQILALAYEIECERNGGDWRLRSVPGQKRTNGPPPKPTEDGEKNENSTEEAESGNLSEQVQNRQGSAEAQNREVASEISQPQSEESGTDENKEKPSEDGQSAEESVEEQMSNLQVSETAVEDEHQDTANLESMEAQEEPSSDQNTSDSDSEGWITPSNLKKHQAKDSGSTISQASEQKTIQVATITTDFAMQNVLLQMNLNLLSTSLNRIKNIRSVILRCHACFQTCRDTTKQFCPRCGKPTLTRVSCSTNQNGEFRLHLKQNMQWNTRGDRYSIPKPQAGTAHGKGTGWGQGLILAEDQKEYQRAVQKEKRTKQRDLMDEDYLPGILTGQRGSGVGGRPKIGAGRTVNSRRQR